MPISTIAPGANVVQIRKRDDGKDDSLQPGNFAGRLHADNPFLFRGEQPHDRWLNDRHQRHIGIRGDGDRTE